MPYEVELRDRAFFYHIKDVQVIRAMKVYSYILDHLYDLARNALKDSWNGKAVICACSDGRNSKTGLELYTIFMHHTFFNHISF